MLLGRPFPFPGLLALGVAEEEGEGGGKEGPQIESLLATECNLFLTKFRKHGSERYPFWRQIS